MSIISYEWIQALLTLPQIIGFIALGIAIFAFKEHNDRKVLIFLAACSGFWAIHFYMLGLFTGAFINLFDVCKNLAGLKWKKNKYWTTGFILAYITIGLGVYFSQRVEGDLTLGQSAVIFLPTIASVLATVGVIYFEGIKMRLFLLATLAVWFSYNFIGGSIPGMASDIILTISTFYGIYKIHTGKRFSLRKLFKTSKKDNANPLENYHV